MTNLYGQIVTRQQIEAAVLATIQTWIQPYIAEVERQAALAPRSIPLPPGSASFHGGLDFDTWREASEPTIIVNAQPYDHAEREGGGTYGQWYEIRVAAICVADQRFYDANAVNQVEDTARDLADLYGAALATLLTQQGGLSGSGTTPFAAKTVLASAPLTEFVDPGAPGVARSIVTIHSYINGLMDETQGPRVAPSNPYTDPGNWPTATVVKFQLSTKDTQGNTGPATGATVTDDDGDIVVTE